MSFCPHHHLIKDVQQRPSDHAWHHSDAQIASWIRGGLGQMPAVGEDWSDGEIDAVLAYVKQWWDPDQLARQTENSRLNP